MTSGSTRRWHAMEARPPVTMVYNKLCNSYGCTNW